MAAHEDDEFEIEPHTPASLIPENNIPVVDASREPRGQFPTLVPASEPMPIQRQTSPVAPALQSGSASRFSHNPYATTGSLGSAPIPLHPQAGSPVHMSDYISPSDRTPIGSLGRHGSQPRTAALPTSAAAVPVINKYYKTEMCRQYTLYPHHCPRGAACTYAHSEEELRTDVGSNRYQQPYPNAGSGPYLGGLPINVGSAPRRISTASMDDGGKMGVAMSQAVPLPSWMSGTGGTVGTSPNSATVGSPAPISVVPVSPLAEAMMRPSSMPRSAVPPLPDTLSSSPDGASKFSGSAYRRTS